MHGSLNAQLSHSIPCKSGADHHECTMHMQCSSSVHIAKTLTKPISPKTNSATKIGHTPGPRTAVSVKGQI